MFRRGGASEKKLPTLVPSFDHLAGHGHCERAVMHTITREKPMFADSGDENDLAVFEASARARRWAKGVGGALLLLGTIPTFYFSADIQGAGDSAKDAGLAIAICMAAMTGLIAITAARGAHDWIATLGIPMKNRGLAQGVTLGSLGAALLVAGLTLVTFQLEAREVSLLTFQYEVSRLPTIGFFEGLMATGFGAAAAMFVARAGRPPAGAEERPSRDFVLRRLMSVGGGFVVMFGIAIGRLYFADPETLVEEFNHGMLFVAAVAGGIVMFVTKPHSDTARALAAERADAAGDEEVQDALREMRRGARRRAFVAIASAVAGLTTAVVGIYLADLVSAELPRDEQPGLKSFMFIMAVGVMVTLAVKKRLAPASDPDPAGVFGGEPLGGLFDDTLATTSGLMVRQQHTLGGLLFGDAAGQKFELVDGGGAWCGTAREESSLWARLFFTARRPLTIAVEDLGETALRVTRPFVWLHEEASVKAGERTIGRIRRTWSPFRAVYRIVDSNNEEVFTLVSGWIFKSRFRVRAGAEKVGELRRVRKPWYVRMFRSSLIPEQDRFALTFPPHAEMDARRLLVGALFLIDASH